MGFDSLPLQEQQSLQRDGIHNLEILSPSNIEDSCSYQTNPKFPHYFESVMILHGMMLFIDGMKRLSPQQVSSVTKFHTYFSVR